jgi:hypothetical protein
MASFTSRPPEIRQRILQILMPVTDVVKCSCGETSKPVQTTPQQSQDQVQISSTDSALADTLAPISLEEIKHEFDIPMIDTLRLVCRQFNADMACLRMPTRLTLHIENGACLQAWLLGMDLRQRSLFKTITTTITVSVGSEELAWYQAHLANERIARRHDQHLIAQSWFRFVNITNFNIAVDTGNEAIKTSSSLTVSGPINSPYRRRLLQEEQVGGDFVDYR